MRHYKNLDAVRGMRNDIEAAAKGNGWDASICIQKHKTEGWKVGKDFLQ